MNGSNVLAVGLGEIKVSRHGGDLLVCYGLGSCIGIAVHDPRAGVGGMAHVVLPSSQLGRGGDLPGKFADTAVSALLSELVALGAQKSRLVVKLAGGARMLNLLNQNAKLDIGGRNIEAVREALAEAGLTAAAEDVGGTVGRTFTLMMETGKTVISTVGRGAREL